MPNSLKARLKKLKYQGVLSQEDIDRIVILPPKTGRWIKYGIPRCEEQHYQCTNCNYYINFGKWGELYTKEFKYCPNCGCRMSEES